MITNKEHAARIVNETYGCYDLDGLGDELAAKYGPRSGNYDEALYDEILTALAERESVEK